MLLGFEAAVAGVVPVVRVLRESLAGAPIERIHGIVNGTTNFILSEMARGCGYEEALAEAQRLGYAEADPTDDVGGADAAAKMAILARLAFGDAGAHRRRPLRGHRASPATTSPTRASSGLSLKLIGTAERREGGLSVRVHPAFLYGGHPLASVSGAFNAVTVESEAITEITMSGPGRGRPQTASAVLGDVVGAMTGGRPPAGAAARRCELIEDVVSAFYLHMEVDDRPGVLAQIAQVLGEHGASIKSVVQHGLGERAQLMMVTHPLSSRACARPSPRSRSFDFVRSPPRAISVIDEEFCERCRPSRALRTAACADRALPRAAAVRARDPVVTLGEGSTPLLLAPRLSERVGAEVHLKLEGANPTGSFKDRGMTCAVSAAVREGAKAVICASTGNTAASAAAYAAKAGLPAP